MLGKVVRSHQLGLASANLAADGAKFIRLKNQDP